MMANQSLYEICVEETVFEFLHKCGGYSPVAFSLRSGTLVKLAYVMKKRSTDNALELFRQLVLLPSRWTPNTFCGAQALFIIRKRTSEFLCSILFIADILIDSHNPECAS